MHETLCPDCETELYEVCGLDNLEDDGAEMIVKCPSCDMLLIVQCSVDIQYCISEYQE